jgi:hypothetical protein
MMRRILLLVTAALVVAAMLVVMAVPAIASHGVPHEAPCDPPTTRVDITQETLVPGPIPVVNYTCVPSGKPSS